MQTKIFKENLEFEELVKLFGDYGLDIKLEELNEFEKAEIETVQLDYEEINEQIVKEFIDKYIRFVFRERENLVKFSKGFSIVKWIVNSTNSDSISFVELIEEKVGFRISRYSTEMLLRKYKNSIVKAIVSYGREYPEKIDLVKFEFPNEQIADELFRRLKEESIVENKE